jgi:putative phosphoribosyl transferase
MMPERFEHRVQAGQALGQRLAELALPRPLVVLALPRGGVPVAAEVARALQAPLDLLLVRKIGLPWQPELALAAVVEGDPPQIVVDDQVRRMAGVDDAYIHAEAQRQLKEITRQRQRYLRGRRPVDLRGATVVVVDDGVATGTTVRAALKALPALGVARRVLAVPVAPAQTLQALQPEVDQVVCLMTPEPFRAVGLHYRCFDQVEDEEVIAALDAAQPATPEGEAR